MSEMIVAFYNETSIEHSRIGFVRDRATESAQKPSRRGKPLSVLADMLVQQSFLVFRATPTFLTLGHAAKQLRREHREFCDAVRWLCLPKHPNFSLAQPEMKYIENHALRHFRRFLGVADGRLVLLSAPTHVVDLFCVFLLSECRNKEPKEMPVKLCRRCHKLFSAFDSNGKQTAKDFCTTKCQNKHFWSKEKRADYRYLERLIECYNPYSPSSFHDRITKAKTQNRLSEIEGRWRDWPKMVEMLEQIGSFASDASSMISRRFVRKEVVRQ